MCSIVGYYRNKPDLVIQKKYLLPLVKESRIRGLHAFGMSYWSRDNEQVVDVKFHDDEEMHGYIRHVQLLDAVFHSRYCTSGDWTNHSNNQPIVLDDMHLAFNGVISMATKSEMEQQYNVKLQSDNDGELFLQHIKRTNDPIEFISKTPGSFAGIWYMDGVLYAARNERRPLWYIIADYTVMFASTLDIMRRAFGEVAADHYAVACKPNVLYTLQDML